METAVAGDSQQQVSFTVESDRVVNLTSARQRTPCVNQNTEVLRSEHRD